MSFAAATARANASVFKALGMAAELDFVPVVGIFDRAYAEVFDGMATSRPRFTLPTEAAKAATHDSQLRVGDERFRVRSIEPDGTGVTVLTLETAL